MIVHWQFEGIKPSYEVRDEIIRDALHASGLRTQSLDEIPMLWAREAHGTIRRRLHRLSLRENEDDIFERSGLTDVGIKFLLEVQRRMGDRK